jgi:hypothetical protein
MASTLDVEQRRAKDPGALPALPHQHGQRLAPSELAITELLDSAIGRDLQVEGMPSRDAVASIMERPALVDP